MHPLNNLRALKRLRAQFGADDEQIQDWYRHWCAEGFQAFEAALPVAQDGGYALGAAPTLVECYLIPQVYNALRYGADLTPFERVRAIVQACASLPAFVAARPENQPDAPQSAAA
jgi:maleylacetoacetate isomerase